MGFLDNLKVANPFGLLGSILFRNTPSSIIPRNPQPSVIDPFNPPAGSQPSGTEMSSPTNTIGIASNQTPLQSSLISAPPQSAESLSSVASQQSTQQAMSNSWLAGQAFGSRIVAEQPTTNNWLRTSLASSRNSKEIAKGLAESQQKLLGLALKPFTELNPFKSLLGTYLTGGKGLQGLKDNLLHGDFNYTEKESYKAHQQSLEDDLNKYLRDEEGRARAGLPSSMIADLGVSGNLASQPRENKDDALTKILLLLLLKRGF